MKNPSVESRTNVVVIVNKIIATRYYEKKADDDLRRNRVGGGKVRANEDVIEAKDRTRWSGDEWRTYY